MSDLKLEMGLNLDKSSKNIEKDIENLKINKLVLEAVLTITEAAIKKHLSEIQKLVDSQQAIKIRTELDNTPTDAAKVTAKAETESKKLKDIYKNIANEIKENISKAFGITDKKALDEVTKLSTQWLKLTVDINKSNIENDIFDKVFDAISQFDSEISDAQDTYKGLIDYINSSNTKIKMTPFGDRAEYEAMRKSYGIGKVSSTSGLPMDVFYQEVKSQFPILDDIDNAEDQFIKLAEILKNGRNYLKANKITKAEIEEYFGGKDGIKNTISEIFDNISIDLHDIKDEGLWQSLLADVEASMESVTIKAPEIDTSNIGEAIDLIGTKTKVESESITNSTQLAIASLNQLEDKIDSLQNQLMTTKGNSLISANPTSLANDVSYIFNNLGQFSDELMLPSGFKENLANLSKAVDYIDVEFVEVQDSIHDATDELDAFDDEAKQATGTTQKLGGSAATTAGQIVTFHQACLVAKKIIRDAVDYLIKWDNTLNEIQLTAFKTREEVENLGKSYLRLSKDMSVSSLEVGKASVEFFRQDLGDNEVSENLQETIKFSKIAKMDLVESAEAITAAMNSMGLTAQQVIDTYSYVGDATATSAKDIAIAIQKSGGTAAAQEVEFQKLVSWIAVVSSKTREMPESIGTSINSVLARLKQLREKGFVELEIGNFESINQVAKALSHANISLVDSQTKQLRNSADVLDELANKYSTLDENTQTYISSVLGFTHQQSRLSNLLLGYSDSISLYEESLNAAGIANEKFAVWTESSEAALGKFKATLEGVYQNLMSSEFIKEIINDGTRLLEVISTIAGALNTPIGHGAIAFLLTSVNVATTNTPYVQKCA